MATISNSISNKDELEWILYKITNTADIYLLEQTTIYKDYPTSWVHEVGMQGGVEEKRIYGKIKDILKLRLIEHPDLDKAIKLKHLAAFDGYVEASKVDITSKGEKLESVVFYLPDNGRDSAGV